MNDFRKIIASGIRAILLLIEASGFVPGFRVRKRNFQGYFPLGLIPIRVRARR
jgi:hypothetical protein